MYFCIRTGAGDDAFAPQLVSECLHHFFLFLLDSSYFTVPPSKSSLVQTPVSTLSVDGICDYFASKGNPVSKAVLNNEEFLDIFIKNVRADYSCLEAHPVTTASIKARLIVIGGELDKGVELGDLEGWKRHHAGGSNETEDVLIKVYAQQGHFYVSDHSVLMDLGDFVATTSCDIHEDKGEDSGLDAMVSTVKTIFSKVLRVDIALIGLSSNFFELGGSSLDTIALICRIERDVSIQGRSLFSSKCDIPALRI